MSQVSSQQNAARTQPDTSRFNGLQTTGRQYRNLSAAEHTMSRDVDQPIPLRDGGHLLADVYRPVSHGRFPVLIAASPYPRQLQDLGAPTAIIEAGNSEFFVSRGYVHLIVNLRGTGGSSGEWGFFNEQERQDLYDLVEWAAGQPWSDGNIGMIGISYFAIAQIGAAVARPPHLKAVFPFEVSPDMYEAAYHYGLFSSSFMSPWLTMLGVTAPKGLREIDVGASRTGAPVLPCRNPQAVPIGEPADYRIPLVPSARRFAAGHRIQLMITSDDQPRDIPVFLGYRHSPVGTTARNTIHATSGLMIPVLRPSA